MTGLAKKKLLVVAVVITAGLIQSCTKSHGQSQNVIPEVVTIKHVALSHKEINRRIAIEYNRNYRLVSSITSCYEQSCITTLVFKK